MRTVVAPMNDATFAAMPFRSRNSRYSPSVVHRTSYRMSPCSASSSTFIESFSGPIDSPSPNTSSVTPCTMSDSERPSSMSDSVAQLSMLMKPGATAVPETSIWVGARMSDRSPIATIVSPAIATSATTGGPPEPS